MHDYLELERVKTQFIIHIGRHKTGTSAIQQMLWNNLDQLEEHGFHLCRTGTGTTTARRQHAMLHRQLIEMGQAFRKKQEQHAGLSGRLIEMGQAFREKITGKKPATWEKLSSEASKQCYRALLYETEGLDETCLLTSEGFQNASPELMALLYPPENTTIVLYLREQLSYLLSAYAQSVQGLHQTTEPLSEYADFFDLSYLKRVDDWVRIYGRDRLVLRIYERERFPGGDVRLDFLQALQITDHEGFDFSKADANPSISGTLLEFKRVVNKVSPLPPGDLLGLMYPLTRQLALEHASFRGGISVDDDFSERIRARYRSSNTEMFEKYFPGMGGFREKSFVSKGKPAGYLDPAELPIIWDFLREREPTFVKEHYDLVMHELDQA